MNDLDELLAAPAARSMPRGRLEQRKAALVEAIDADLRSTAARAGRLRALRAWLTSFSIFLALLGLGLFAPSARSGEHGAHTVVVAAVGGGAAVAALAATSRHRLAGPEAVRRGSQRLAPAARRGSGRRVPAS
jgi:hypothetical protein